MNESHTYRYDTPIDENTQLNLYSLLVAIFAVGGMLGGLMAGWWADFFGRCVLRFKLFIYSFIFVFMYLWKYVFIHFFIYLFTYLFIHSSFITFSFPIVFTDVFVHVAICVCFPFLFRKFGMLLNNAFAFAAGGLFFFSREAHSYEMIIVARLLIGFNCGKWCYGIQI